MAKVCPITNAYVLYLDCLECDDKVCRKERKDDAPESVEQTRKGLESRG